MRSHSPLSVAPFSITLVGMDRHPHPRPRHAPPAGRAPAHTGSGTRLPPGLDRELSSEDINRLPIAAYRGPIHLINQRPQMLAAVKDLRRESLLGFDTEKRPSFKKGEFHPPALMQLAGRDAVYVFQLHVLGLPAELADILADPRIVKAGVATGRDIQELRTLTEFQPRGFVDLGGCAKRSGIKHHGLRGLAALLLGCRISKGAQLTNWERSDLPGNALQYAATDAWIGRRIYVALKEHGCLDEPSHAAGHSARGLRGLWHRARKRIAGIVRSTRRARHG